MTPPTIFVPNGDVYMELYNIWAWWAVGVGGCLLVAVDLLDGKREIDGVKLVLGNNANEEEHIPT